MTKSEVVKSWKPELKRMGFVWKKGAFYREETLNESIRLMIALQKNLHSDTYKINPSILLSSAFGDPAEEELFLRGNLRKDGIHFHEMSSSWWRADDLPEALEAVKKYVVPWFQEWGRAGRLVDVLERAIAEQTSLIDAAEPLPPAQTEAPWGQNLPAKRRITATDFYHAAILHYLNHDSARALDRMRKSIQGAGFGDEDLKAKAQRQLGQLEKTGTNSA